MEKKWVNAEDGQSHHLSGVGSTGWLGGGGGPITEFLFYKGL